MTRLDTLNCDQCVELAEGSADQHFDLFADLQTLLLGELGAEHTPAALMLPFTKQVLYASPRFESLKSGIAGHHDGMLPGQIGVDGFEDIMALQAYMVILDRLYHLPLKMNAGMVLSSLDPADGIHKQFRLEMDFRFCELDRSSSCQTLPVLNESDRAQILERLNDIDFLTTLLPPSDFSFNGFIISRLVEVSHEHILADLKEALTEVDALTETNKLGLVQEQVRKLTGKSELDIMLIAVRQDMVYQLNPDARHCEYQGLQRSSLADFNQTFFRESFDSGLARVVSDLPKAAGSSAAEQAMLAGGIKSLLFIPLILHGQKVGGLLLQATSIGYFSPLDVLNLKEVLPAFAIALSRGLDNFESRIRSIIQEQYTAIHPAVEWKFRRAAQDLLMEGAKGKSRDQAPVVSFDKVWPLYSVSDIRSSSHFRNEAIRADLQRQIALAAVAVEAGRSFRPLPYLDELAFRLEEQGNRLRDSLSSGDEIELLGFLTQEVEPAMASLEGFGPATDAARLAYAGAIHPEHQSIYDKRRDFDESVSRLNRSISSFVDRIQPEAQAMFPHYFDKNSTDGVDMNMYIGPSLVHDDSWRPMYLKNLRLWQFIVLCRVAHLTWKVRDQLPLPLQTTHLMVVQDMPISIRFNQDEKRFAVDGAYNIRYEIMKKRIDKAVVKGTGERLTQPDRIAIVYSQPSEALEYERYIRYLQSKGYLEDPVEHLELDDLQGISGLKALRVWVRLEAQAGSGQRVGLAEDFQSEEQSIMDLIQREFHE